MILRKWNRMLAQWGRKRKKVIVLNRLDLPDNPRKIVVWYDDLKNAKKPRSGCVKYCFPRTRHNKRKTGFDFALIPGYIKKAKLWRYQKMGVPESKIIDKIRKLLALGESNPNENEAQAAILKAHELMAEHGIASVSADEDISYATESCEHRGDRKFRRNLASIIAPNFKCRYYLSNGTVTFFGRADDARIAKEVFQYAYLYAHRESNRLYAQYRKQGHSGRGIVNSYALGFIHGLKEKLDAQSTALMVITPPDVSDEYAAVKKKLGLRSTTSTLSTSRGNRSVYDRGLADGRTVMNGRRLESAV